MVHYAEKHTKLILMTLSDPFSKGGTVGARIQLYLDIFLAFKQLREYKPSLTGVEILHIVALFEYC